MFWIASDQQKLEEFEHHNDQNSVNGDVDTENDNNDDSLSTNHDVPNLKKGDKATSKNKKSVKWEK